MLVAGWIDKNFLYIFREFSKINARSKIQTKPSIAVSNGGCFLPPLKTAVGRNHRLKQRLEVEFGGRVGGWAGGTNRRLKRRFDTTKGRLKRRPEFFLNNMNTNNREYGCE
jgi:hypothetical protein